MSFIYSLCWINRIIRLKSRRTNRSSGMTSCVSQANNFHCVTYSDHYHRHLLVNEVVPLQLMKIGKKSCTQEEKNRWERKKNKRKGSELRKWRETTQRPSKISADRDLKSFSSSGSHFEERGSSLTQRNDKETHGVRKLKNRIYEWEAQLTVRERKKINYPCLLWY